MFGYAVRQASDIRLLYTRALFHQVSYPKLEAQRGHLDVLKFFTGQEGKTSMWDHAEDILCSMK